jgi:hypothetical protein
VRCVRQVCGSRYSHQVLIREEVDTHHRYSVLYCVCTMRWSIFGTHFSPATNPGQSLGRLVPSPLASASAPLMAFFFLSSTIRIPLFFVCGRRSAVQPCPTCFHYPPKYLIQSSPTKHRPPPHPTPSCSLTIITTYLLPLLNMRLFVGDVKVMILNDTRIPLVETFLSVHVIGYLGA